MTCNTQLDYWVKYVYFTFAGINNNDDSVLESSHNVSLLHFIIMFLIYIYMYKNILVGRSKFIYETNGAYIVTFKMWK